MAEIVDRAVFSIDSPSQGAKTLETVSEVRIQRTKTVTMVKTLRPQRRPLGKTRGVPELTVTISARKTVPPEINWRQMRDEEETFQLFYQVNDNGDRTHLVNLEISEINDAYNSEGESIYEITCPCEDELDE